MYAPYYNYCCEKVLSQKPLSLCPIFPRNYLARRDREKKTISGGGLCQRERVFPFFRPENPLIEKFKKNPFDGGAAAIVSLLSILFRRKSLLLTNQISSIGFGGLSYTCIAVVAKRGLLVLVLGEEEKEDGGISRTIGGGLSLSPFSSCFVAVSNLPPPSLLLLLQPLWWACMERGGEECLGKTESKTFTKVSLS